MFIDPDLRLSRSDEDTPSFKAAIAILAGLLLLVIVVMFCTHELKVQGCWSAA
jgi:hypothetical protein